MTNPLVDQAGEAFAAALIQWRAARGMSKKQLAAQMSFDPSYVSHVEACRHRPTEDFARRAEAVLRAGGAIWQSFREYEVARRTAADGPVPRQRHPPRGASPTEPVTTRAGLVVEREHAALSYVDHAYRCTVRRDLFNDGTEPITRYLARISVDRYPGEAERSNRFYREHPLGWSELDLEARCEGEPMLWQAKQDRDAFKEVWLLFENDGRRFPLYPGQRAAIEYAYSVGEDKWGQWFQRAVRLPTRHLVVRLDFPEDLDPVVWGVESSLTAEAGPLRTPVDEHSAAGRTVFEWATDDPALGVRFRLEWRFRGPRSERNAEEPAAVGANGTGRAGLAARVAGVRPSDLMRGTGIVQRGAPMLERAARWLDLPDQATLARDVVSRLLDALHRVGELHEFGKGVGLAAPQLGISWAAAVVRGPDGGGPIVLVNPRIVAESVDQDEQYEGCLSFFDVRGVVSRPLLVEVEHEDLTGARTVTTFTQALARLVAHEVDHLGGLLYSDRMPPDGRLVPVEDYPDHGQPWHYP